MVPPLLLFGVPSPIARALLSRRWLRRLLERSMEVTSKPSCWSRSGRVFPQSLNRMDSNAPKRNTSDTKKTQIPARPRSVDLANVVNALSTGGICA